MRHVLAVEATAHTPAMNLLSAINSSRCHPKIQADARNAIVKMQIALF
jgi:hypothetical protein